MPDYEDAAREAAEDFRRENGLGIAPVADVVALIEQAHDVDVTVLDVDDTDEHGLTMIDPIRGATIVAVASSDRPMRWRSTLAHELGHLVFRDHDNGKPANLAAASIPEKRAQSFARHLLIPAQGIAHFVDHHRGSFDLKAFSDLVQRFQVSPAVAAIQLRNGRTIDEASYRDLSGWSTPALAARFGWTDHYRTLRTESSHRRAPQRLLARLVEGYVAGLVTLETVASVRGVSPDQLAEEFADAHITPEPATVEQGDDDLFAGACSDVDLSWLDDT